MQIARTTDEIQNTKHTSTYGKAIFWAILIIINNLGFIFDPYLFFTCTYFSELSREL